MKPAIATKPVARTFNRRTGERLRRLELACVVDPSPEDESVDEEMVFAGGGSIFGDTSLVEDALLREAIAGRFLC